MKVKPVIYLGRAVDKTNFRTNVYNPKGEKKVVESWLAYESAIQSGLWFATRQDAKESIAPVVEEPEMKEEVKEEMEVSQPQSKSKSKPKSKSKGTTRTKVEEVAQDNVDDLEDDGMVYEVKGTEL